MRLLLFIGLCQQAFLHTGTVSARSLESSEELAEDLLVPVNGTTNLANTESLSLETREVEGSGNGEVYPIPPIPEHLEHMMSRMQVVESAEVSVKIEEQTPVEESVQNQEEQEQESVVEVARNIEELSEGQVEEPLIKEELLQDPVEEEDQTKEKQAEETEEELARSKEDHVDVNINEEKDSSDVEGSGAYEHDGPRSAAMIANIEDPFTREEGMEDVYKELVGEEPIQTDDDNMQDNTLSVIADDSLVKPAEPESIRNEDSRELKAVGSGEDKGTESGETLKEVLVNEDDAEGEEPKKSGEDGETAVDPVLVTQGSSEKGDGSEEKTSKEEVEEKAEEHDSVVLGANISVNSPEEENNSNPEESSSEKPTDVVAEVEHEGSVDENTLSKEKIEDGADSPEKSGNLVVPTSGESNVSAEDATTEKIEDSSESVTIVPVIGVIKSSQEKEESEEAEKSAETDVDVDTSTQQSTEDKSKQEVQEETIVKETAEAIDLPPVDLSNEAIEESSEVPGTTEDISEAPPTTESSEVDVPIAAVDVDDSKSKESSEETTTSVPESNESEETSVVVPIVADIEVVTSEKPVEPTSESSEVERIIPPLDALPDSEIVSSSQPPEPEEEEDSTTAAPQQPSTEEELIVPPISIVETPTSEKPAEPEETTIVGEGETTTNPDAELLNPDVPFQIATVLGKVATSDADNEGNETKRMGAYIFMGVIAVCFVALIIFLVVRNRLRYRGRHVVHNEDSEKALMSMGKFKDDSDDNNVKNNEITPLVIKQNSQINKFEKNPNFSSPKNLNTTANEKNIEKDNVLKSTTQAIIEDEVEDEKKSAEGEKGVEDEKNALMGGDTTVPEKLIVHTRLDQDSIPRKAILVTRNGNGYHPVTQDPV